MKVARFRLAILLMPALAARLSAQAPSADGKGAPDHTIIALSGTAAPGGGNFLSFSFSNVTLNAQHRVAFDAILGGPPVTTGVFVGDGTTTSTVALGINPDPNAPSFGFVSNPFLTSGGFVVFDVSDVGIFAGNGRTSIALARAGDAAPGGGTMGPPGERSVNDQGTVAYLTGVNGSSATEGIFRTSGQQTVAIVRDDQSPPTGGSFAFFSGPVMNEGGQVAFVSAMTGGSADFAVLRGEGGALTPVFASRQAVPRGGGDATFEDFGVVVINRHGQVGALALLANSTSRFGLFLGDGSNAVAIALDGQAAPKGGNYGDPFGRSTFRGPIRLNDRGDLAFDVSLTGGSSTSGIFRGNGERTSTVALAETSAPGTTGTFQSFDDFKLGVDGRVAFIGTLKLGVGGVDATNNKGIWIGTSEDDLQLLVRTGDVIGGKVLTRLPQFGQGNQFAMNENGILWVGNFGTTKGVVLTRTVGDNP